MPGVINNITVDSGATGNFTIWIQDDSTPNGAPGASDVKQMDLTYGGGTATVYVLWLFSFCNRGRCSRVASGGMIAASLAWRHKT